MYDLEFTPLDDSAIESLEREEREKSLLAEGNGRWEIITSKAKLSTSGNPMIEINFKVWDLEGKSAFVKDFFMIGEKSFFIKKIKSFCESAGTESVYNTGRIRQEDFRPGLTGDCTIIRKMYKDEPQNNIKEYIKKSEKQNTINENLNDELPF